jgi:biotin-dependent carboxylase-like uncharacterized protein
MPEFLKVKCLKTGLYTSIQDEGRFGVQDQGIPISGALDKSSMRIANELVGNLPNSPVLEMTLFGPTLKFEGQGQIAITGANMKATLNGKPVENYMTLNIKTGDLLEFHNTDFGCRTYMSIGGQWQVQNWSNSFSALPSLMEEQGLPARLVDDYSFTVAINQMQELISCPERNRPLFSECYVIRVVTGPEFDQFEIEVIQDFFDRIFVIHGDSNRMGYRLKDNLQGYVPSGEEISSGIVIGTVQISNAGKPFILMADAQTTGGYPRIANVISDDLEIVAQLKPGDELKFMLVSLE